MAIRPKHGFSGVLLPGIYYWILMHTIKNVCVCVCVCICLPVLVYCYFENEHADSNTKSNIATSATDRPILK